MILTVAPIVAGALLYLLGVSFGWSIYVGNLLFEATRQRFPKVEEHGFSELGSTPTLFNAERVLANLSSSKTIDKINSAWAAAWFAGLIIYCVGAFAQICYYALTLDTGNVGLSILTCVIGILLVLRGGFVTYCFVEAA